MSWGARRDDRREGAVSCSRYQLRLTLLCTPVPAAGSTKTVYQAGHTRISTRLMGRRGSRKPEKPRAPVTALLENFLVEVKKLAPGLTDVRARVSSTDWYPRAAMTSCNHSRSRCDALAGCVSRILELFQRAITSRDCSRSWRASLTVGLPMSPFLLLTSGSLGWGWRTSRGPEWLQKTSRGRKGM